MNYLSVEQLFKSYNEVEVLRDLTFGISKGQKVALVGKNGCGKSTLLRILAGAEKQDAGNVVFRNGIKLRHLDQNPEFGVSRTIRDYFFDDEDELLRAILDYEQFATGIKEDTGGSTFEALTQKIESINGWDFEAQVKQILGKLKIHGLDREIATLSGGERKRVALARVLLERPDFLILDEPTNHLDIEVIEWLEKYLSTQKLSLLLVTHDRYFLEKVTHQILELEDGVLYSYKGNYGYFLQKKSERKQQQSAEVEKARNLLVKELDWLNRMPKARGTKAKYRIESVYELQDKAKSGTRDQQLMINISMPRQGKKILELEHIQKSFEDTVCLQDFSYVFKKGDKIGVVGNNGTGKSTLLNIITEKIEPDQGSMVKGETTVFGYYRQDELSFSTGQKVIDIVKEVAEVVRLDNGNTISASQFLQHFMFSPKTHYVHAEKLSGGEKRRLQLMRTLMEQPNFLILDEPTNDLDIYTLNVLEEYLLNFKGILMVVTHDRYFLDKITNHTFAFSDQGHVRDFPGKYSDYRDKATSEDAFRITNGKKSKPKRETSRQVRDKNRITYKEKRELEGLELEITEMESRKESLLQLIQKGTEDHEQMLQWSADYERLSSEIERKSERWLELSELAENS